ncbi:hypothetical protein [Streptomyces sp. UG1]|uniref:hypothetical protein n=1 Tax=Streptomyces sp. UG1 TaxID=3417652 RepID=UPI003CE76BFB
MSAVLIRILTCDGLAGGEICGEEFGGDTGFLPLVTLRRRAREAGWRRRRRGRDLCPACVKDGAR